MTSSFRIPITLPNLSSFSAEPSSSSGIQRRTIRKKIGFLLGGNGCSSSSIKCSADRWSFVEAGTDKDGILMARRGKGRRESLVVVRANQGFGGGGGGGGWDKGSTSRILGNLALALGLTYLSMTGQLGWILDAIVSIWVSFSLLD